MPSLFFSAEMAMRQAGSCMILAREAVGPADRARWLELAQNWVLRAQRAQLEAKSQAIPLDAS